MILVTRFNKEITKFNNENNTILKTCFDEDQKERFLMNGILYYVDIISSVDHPLGFDETRLINPNDYSKNQEAERFLLRYIGNGFLL
jgi:hypothetical protein